MAQSHPSAPAPGQAGAEAHWEPVGSQGDEPASIWSQTPPPPVMRPSIAVTESPVDTDLAQVLSEWRAAERRLDEHIEASPMRSLLQSEIARLRAEYQSLFARKR